MASLSQSGFLAICAVLLFVLNGCSLNPRKPVPDSLIDKTEIPGIPDARIWGDDVPPRFEEVLRNMKRETAIRELPALVGVPHNYLAISGGGAQGAFGAGLLVGWTKTGKRPEFQMVTGVSTGALIAIWAFLGPDYDDTLKALYTNTSTEDIIQRRPLLTVPFTDAAASSGPLLDLLRKSITDDVIDRIARESKRGRRLFIGTADLDSMRPRIWDITRIAASDHPGAKSLIHNVLLASASIPGLFPPVRIAVEAESRIYDELHVDGGTTTQVFVYPTATDWRKVLDALDVPGKANIYVIRNAELVPDREQVTPRVIPISSRSLSSLIRTQGLGDLYQIYMVARRDRAEYNLAYIPDTENNLMPEELFDPEYMKGLFEVGYSMAKEGYPWLKTPPGWVRPIDEEK